MRKMHWIRSWVGEWRGTNSVLWIFIGIEEDGDAELKSLEIKLGRTKQPYEVELIRLDSYGKISSWKITSREAKTDVIEIKN